MEKRLDKIEKRLTLIENEQDEIFRKAFFPSTDHINWNIKAEELISQLKKRHEARKKLGRIDDQVN